MIYEFISCRIQNAQNARKRKANFFFNCLKLAVLESIYSIALLRCRPHFVSRPKLNTDKKSTTIITIKRLIESKLNEMKMGQTWREDEVTDKRQAQTNELAREKGKICGAQIRVAGYVSDRNGFLGTIKYT